MRLGQLINALESQPRENEVHFDFVYFVPTGISSYRGFYDHLALEYGSLSSTNTNIDAMKVPEFLELCRSAVGKVFTGWKGGDYRMNERTTVWVANPREVGGTQVVGVEDHGHITIITTRYVGE